MSVVRRIWAQHLGAKYVFLKILYVFFFVIVGQTQQLSVNFELKIF